MWEAPAWATQVSYVRGSYVSQLPSHSIACVINSGLITLNTFYLLINQC